MVYENCKFYGPYSSKKDSRLRCILKFPDGKKEIYVISKIFDGGLFR